MASYRELYVWKKAMKLVVEVYRLCASLPKDELFGLSQQMKRAAVSIPSNIAEGQARNSDKEFIHFLLISQGSRAELETQLELCRCLSYISDVEFNQAGALSAETGKMMRALINSLKKSLKILTTANC